MHWHQFFHCFLSLWFCDYALVVGIGIRAETAMIEIFLVNAPLQCADFLHPPSSGFLQFGPAKVFLLVPDVFSKEDIYRYRRLFWITPMYQQAAEFHLWIIDF